MLNEHKKTLYRENILGGNSYFAIYLSFSNRNAGKNVRFLWCFYFSFLREWEHFLSENFLSKSKSIVYFTIGKTLKLNKRKFHSHASTRTDGNICMEQWILYIYIFSNKQTIKQSNTLTANQKERYKTIPCQATSQHIIH